MENRKNLCAMIPESLYTQVCSEKEQLEMTLSQYVEKILKEHLKKTGVSQKEFVITLIEQALLDAEKKETVEKPLVETTE